MAAKEIKEVKEKPPAKTLTDYVEEIYQVIERAKGDGIQPIPLVGGVATKLGMTTLNVLMAGIDSAISGKR